MREHGPARRWPPDGCAIVPIEVTVIVIVKTVCKGAQETGPRRAPPPQGWGLGFPPSLWHAGRGRDPGVTEQRSRVGGCPWRSPTSSPRARFLSGFPASLGDTLSLPPGGLSGPQGLQGLSALEPSLVTWVTLGCVTPCLRSPLQREAAARGCELT